MMKKTSAQTIALGSFAVASVVLLMKIVAWRLTGSVALYSDALETLVNVAGAILAYAAIRYAERPADKSHPFGHHKAENFSAIAEGTLILVAAILILQEAIGALFSPQLETLGPVGLAVSVAAMVLNLVWARYLISVGKLRRSPALEANGRHLMTDVWTTVGVILGLVLVLVTGWAIFDPILAILVALNILREGWRVVFLSAGDLMDAAAPESDTSIIEAAVLESAQGAIQVHDLRTRRAGQALFVDFHLVVSGDMTVRRSHEICDAIEQAIRDKIPEARTTIHVEPNEWIKEDGLNPRGEPPTP